MSYSEVKQLPPDEYGDLVEFVLNAESHQKVKDSERKTFEINIARYIANVAGMAELHKEPGKFALDAYNALLGEEDAAGIPGLDANNPFFKSSIRAGKNNGKSHTDN